PRFAVFVAVLDAEGAEVFEFCASAPTLKTNKERTRMKIFFIRLSPKGFLFNFGEAKAENFTPTCDKAFAVGETCFRVPRSIRPVPSECQGLSAKVNIKCRSKEQSRKRSVERSKRATLIISRAKGSRLI